MWKVLSSKTKGVTVLQQFLGSARPLRGVKPGCKAPGPRQVLPGVMTSSLLLWQDHHITARSRPSSALERFVGSLGREGLAPSREVAGFGAGLVAVLGSAAETPLFCS